jgi:hypothetical protein
MSELIVISKEEFRALKEENERLDFEYKTLAKLVYDYLCVGEKIMTKEELKTMAKEALEDKT